MDKFKSLLKGRDHVPSAIFKINYLPSIHFSSLYAFSTEENFLLINGVTDEIVLELGPHINERISPCSTFKITLSLMGYDAGILKDEKTPIWDFQEGYDDWLESWKAPQTPSILDEILLRLVFQAFSFTIRIGKDSKLFNLY